MLLKVQGIKYRCVSPKVTLCFALLIRREEDREGPSLGELSELGVGAKSTGLQNIHYRLP